MQQRKGFTLVEMMVAMALTLFIMVILSQAFVAALETFRQLKSIGDMEERLRSVSTLLRRELAADHFEGRKRLSDPGFFYNGPPREGFFRIYQGSATVLPGTPGAVDIWEGYDSDFIGSTRATDHLLHFTVKLRGNNPQDFFSANIGADAASPLILYQSPTDSRYQASGSGSYTSQWAEVAYFLRANGDMTGGTPGTMNPPLPMFSLYRRARLLVPNNQLVNYAPPVGQTTTPTIPNPPETDAAGYYPVTAYANVSCSEPTGPFPAAVYFNSPNDITIPDRRFAMSPNNGATNNPLITYSIANGSYPILADNGTIATPGADLLLTDVISFDIRFLMPQSAAPRMNPTTGGLIDPFIDLYDSEAQIAGAATLPVLQLAPPPALPPAGPSNTLFANFSATGVPAGPKVFDTWSSVNDGVYNYSSWATTGTATSLPLQLNIQAIKITLRIWDKKTQRTRQVSFIQDM